MTKMWCDISTQNGKKLAAKHFMDSFTFNVTKFSTYRSTAPSPQGFHSAPPTVASNWNHFPGNNFVLVVGSGGTSYAVKWQGSTIVWRRRSLREVVLTCSWISI